MVHEDVAVMLTVPGKAVVIMKNRRLLAALLAAVFLLAPWTVAPAENDFLPEEFSDFSARFGKGAAVELDENGKPVSVNGYPLRQVDTCFNVRAVEEKIVASTDFLDYPFWQPATEYDGNLALMSLYMALCSARDLMRDEDPLTFDPAQNAETYLLSAGFTDLRKDDYSKETSIYTISTAMGSRRMEHEGEEPFTLIAVCVCGGGYKNEWQSNLTAGNGDLHEGFRSASDLVIDRIAGYIATRCIKGRVKIWISGFSRAAAVANLTAGRLTHAGTFPKEDVYAYTYATPAAVLNPPETGDENIYNIICPTDAVPQVMPADWNYGRYGRDLFLPVPEFSTAGEISVVEREFNIKDAFGIDIHYSGALNLRMRMLLSMAYEAIESRENYVRNIQDTAVGILQKKNAGNMLITMRNMLLSIKNGDAETRGKVDGLLNYLIRVFGNALTRTELAAVNRNSGSSMLLLFTEHREDAYLASTYDIQNGLFEENPDFTYVMVKGPVELELTIDEVPGWIMTMDEKGSVSVAVPNSDVILQDPEHTAYYMERIGNVSVAAVPGDLAIRARWKAVSDGTVEVIRVGCGLRVSQQYPGAETGEMKVRAGDTGMALIPAQAECALPDGFHEKTFHASDLTGFLGISLPLVSWRLLVTGILLLAGLAVFLILRLASLLIPNRTKNGAAVWCLLALFCVAAVEAEGAYWLLADMPLLLTFWKAAAGAAVLGVFFLRRNRNGKTGFGLLPVLAAIIAADLAAVWSTLPGAALLLLGHMLLIACFLREKPISRAAWLQWAVISVLSAGLLFLVFIPKTGPLGWGAVAFAPVLLMTAYCSGGRELRIRYAAGFLLTSDLLLGAYLFIWKEPLAHILCMALLSIALMLLALGKKEAETVPRRV